MPATLTDARPPPSNGGLATFPHRVPAASQRALAGTDTARGHGARPGSRGDGRPCPALVGPHPHVGRRGAAGLPQGLPGAWGAGRFPGG